jgi:hypothetical protein
MAVSPFHRLNQAQMPVLVELKGSGPNIIIHGRPRRRNLDLRKKAALRTRASVRRASGFVQILITLIL